MRQRIKEAVGVPANIEIAAQNLYNDIVKKLKNKEIGPEDVVKFKFINKVKLFLQNIYILNQNSLLKFQTS